MWQKLRLKLAIFCTNKHIFTGVSIILALTFFTICSIGLNRSVWNDETYTIESVRIPFAGTLDCLEEDFHPPGYYFALRLLITLADTINGGPGNIAIYAAKAFSLLPILLLVIFALVYLRPRYGLAPASLFAFLLLTGPLVLPYSFEIRMYSWSLFGVALSFFAALALIKKQNTSHWLWFTLSSLLTVYTHYYAGVSVIILWLLVFINFVQTRNWRQIGLQFLAGSIIIVCYLPWLPYLLTQVSKTDSHPLLGQFVITFPHLWHFISPVFTPNGLAPGLIGSITYDFNIFGLFFVIICIWSWLFILEPKYRREVYYSLIIYLLTLVIGLIGYYGFGLLFLPRYLFPCFGLLFWSFSLIFAHNYPQLLLSSDQTNFDYTRNLRSFCLIFLSLVEITGCLFNLYHFYQVEGEYLDAFNSFSRIAAQIKTSKPAYLVYDESYAACLINKLTYFGRSDAVSCLEWEDLDSITTSLQEGNHVFAINNTGSCSQSRRFFAAHGLQASELYSSNFVQKHHCNQLGNICGYTVIAPQCAYELSLK